MFPTSYTIMPIICTSLNFITSCIIHWFCIRSYNRIIR